MTREGIKEKCVHLEMEEIGGMPELKIVQYGLYCRKFDKYNDNIECKGCFYYKIDKDYNRR